MNADDEDARLAAKFRSLPPGTPSAEARERAFAAAQAAWQESLAQDRAPAVTGRARRESAQQRRWAYGMAAAVLLAMAGAWGAWTLRSNAAVLAQLELPRGVVVDDSGEAWSAGASMRRGAIVQTRADSGAVLRLGPDLDLRLDADSRLSIETGSRVRLTAGRLFVAARDGSNAPLTVASSAGEVRHLGTRYQVGLDGDHRLVAAVQEGRIEVTSGALVEQVGAGELIELEDGHVAHRGSIAFDDPGWDWAQSLAAPIPIEGRPLAEFLAWYAQATGREVGFADAATAERAKRAVLHGSVEGLAPADALAAVAASVGLATSTTGSRLTLSMAH